MFPALISVFLAPMAQNVPLDIASTLEPFSSNHGYRPEAEVSQKSRGITRKNYLCGLCVTILVYNSFNSHLDAKHRGKDIVCGKEVVEELAKKQHTLFDVTHSNPKRSASPSCDSEPLIRQKIKSETSRSEVFEPKTFSTVLQPRKSGVLQSHVTTLERLNFQKYIKSDNEAFLNANELLMERVRTLTSKVNRMRETNSEKEQFHKQLVETSGSRT